MATPTPPAAAKRPGGSTPSHPNQSSPPRSVPSPVTARHPAGKTPVNHPTTGSSSGSKTLAGTPMVHNLSQTGNTSSPSANMLALGTPSGLGVEGATPAGLSALTPALGGAQMMPSMSDLGLTPSGGKRNEDEERRIKMRKVLQKIGKAKGRVSEEGIARLARRVGFANDIDAEKLTPEERERKVGNRPVSTAGNAIMIEIDLKNEVPRSVQVTYNTESKALQEHGAKAGKLLLDDLKAPNGIALCAKLDKFAANLERLARMDRLSTNGINCFEAVSGLYHSLERLYEQEKAAVKSLLDVPDAEKERSADLEVMCKRSGKPLVHENDKIGVEIAYWQNNRHHASGSSPRDSDQMDVDGKDDAAPDPFKEIFKLRIEVEPCSAALFPPIRISDNWLPDPLESATDDLGGIPWQDPPQTYTSGTGTDNVMMNGGQQQLPDRRFVARLDPPIIMPSLTAMNIQNVIGTPVAYSMMHQYAGLLLAPDSAPLGQMEFFKTTLQQPVLSYRDGEEVTVQHEYTLENSKPDFGTKLEALPFSHPRQIIQLLPTLRQWACVGSLLQTTFEARSSDKETIGLNGGLREHGSYMDLDQLLKDSDPIRPLPVHITLSTAPTPSLGMIFPVPEGAGVGNYNVEVETNADIKITARDDLYQAPDEADGVAERHEREKRLAKALDASSDMGVWVEWVRTRP